MFLQRVITDILQNYKNINPENMVFVLPHRRGIVFLKKYFAQQIGKVCMSPDFITMDNLLERISGYTKMPELTQLFELYDSYKNACISEPDDFEKFMGWAKMILQDFNDIDHYLIENKKIFPYIYAIKEVEHWSVSIEKPTEELKKHLQFWSELGGYYEAFYEKMKLQKQGYQGFIAREAVKELDTYIQKNNEKLHIFVGFNDLTLAEEKIIKKILTELPSEIYWDIDNKYLKNEGHSAGEFIRKYKKWDYYNKDRQPKWLEENQEEKHIEIIGVPKEINQAHFVAQKIEEIPHSELEKTALVLGEENMLIPVLQSISNENFSINITMGYPLQQTPLNDLFGAYFKLYTLENTSWYHKDVIALLLQPMVSNLLSEEYRNNILNKIYKSNIVYVSKKIILEGAKDIDEEIINLFFVERKEVTPSVLIANAIEIIKIIKNSLNKEEKYNDLYLEYLYSFYQLFSQLYQLQEQFGFITMEKVLRQIYNDLLIKQKLSFQGEPLEGLQIMGIIEAQNIDFERVIITSMNEGIFPLGKSSVSFIPFDVRRVLNLPTYQERDAIYSYYFYRIIQRAKHICLIYNTEAESIKGNEKSRFILQLLEADRNLKETILAPKVNSEIIPPLHIPKTSELMEKLIAIATGNDEKRKKGFSPSALTSYVHNPITFYEQVVLNIQEEQEVEEIIETRTFGKIVHSTLEALYDAEDEYQQKKYIGKILTEKDIEEMQEKVPELVQKNIKEYREEEYLEGKNILIFNVIKEYIHRFLEMEKKAVATEKIEVLAIEEKLKIEVNFPEFSHKFLFNGTADRIERRNGKLYIIDYKTGKVEPNDVKLSENSWENLIIDFKYSKVFQLLMYAYMINKSKLYPDNEIFVGNYSFKNLEKGFMGLKEDKEIIPADLNILNLFEEKLKTLLLEIFNPDIPFVEK
ncbi:MAG: PD-(D/E)XK nuclease family protein [Capnocytophaga sp.]|nr:PD-(D/E)XK nuclease family protein [Capnocytophaga sp.]